MIGECGVPLLPLDQTPPVFPGIEQDLPTVSAQIFLTELEQQQCGNDDALPGIVLWLRNSACSVSSGDGNQISFSQYDCSTEGTIVRTDFGCVFFILQLSSDGFFSIAVKTHVSP